MAASVTLGLLLAGAAAVVVLFEETFPARPQGSQSLSSSASQLLTRAILSRVQARTACEACGSVDRDAMDALIVWARDQRREDPTTALVDSVRKRLGEKRGDRPAAPCLECARAIVRAASMVDIVRQLTSGPEPDWLLSRR